MSLSLGTNIISTSSANALSSLPVETITESVTSSVLETIDSDNILHKTGDETITGNKTMTGSFNFANTTGNLVGDDAYIGDCDLSGTVFIAGRGDSSGLGLLYTSNGDWTKDNGYVLLKNNGNSLEVRNSTGLTNVSCNAVFSNAYDALGTCITTTGISKSGNGYVKLGNGIIIQWGQVRLTASSAGIQGYWSHTFSTPFISAAKVACTTKSLWNYWTHIGTEGVSMTSVSGYVNIESQKQTFPLDYEIYVIAIGY